MLSSKDYNCLLHDLKRSSKCLKLIREEKDEKKRNIILELLQNELDRVFEDLADAKDSKES